MDRYQSDGHTACHTNVEGYEREREREKKKNIHTSRIQLHRECANLEISVDQKPWPAVRWKTVNARYHLSGLCLFFGIIVFGAIRCNWDCSVSA